MNLKINNESLSVYETPCSYIAIYCGESDNVDVSITDATVSVVRPLKDGILPSGHFFVKCPSKTVVEFENGKPLFIFTYKPEVVNPSDFTYYFSAGVHTPPEITLHDDESIYVDYGAIVKTHINTEKASNITICGRGIIDTGEIGAKKHRMLKFIECQQIDIHDVTLLGAIDWCVVLIACDNAKVENTNIVTWEVNGDGIDVVGSENIDIRNCFAYATDDCISLKATAYDDERGCKNVKNIAVHDCIFWNTRPGNVMEIGFETRCEEICNVLFENCDVLHCEYEGWQSGGVFTIHNGDRADIHDVVYRNIRIEDASQKLFDVKVFNSHYSVDTERGHVHDILAENIIVQSEFLPPSIFRGCDNAHGIKNVTIHNLQHCGKIANSLLMAHIIAESGSEVKFI